MSSPDRSLRERLIIAAGELLLTTQEIASPSLRAVARACSVSPAAVYLHFESSDALFDAVMASHLDDLRRFVSSVVARTIDPTERLTTSLLAYAEWAMAHRGGYQLLFESAEKLGSPDRHSVPLTEAELSAGGRWDLLGDLGDDLAHAIPEGHLVRAELTRAALRLWTAAHGIVSLRLHKPMLQWPTPIDQEIRFMVGAVIEATMVQK